MIVTRSHLIGKQSIGGQASAASGKARSSAPPAQPCIHVPLEPQMNLTPFHMCSNGETDSHSLLILRLDV
jgi:hypothetical protein